SSGKLSTVKDGEGNTSEYAYDGGGRLSKLTHPNGDVTRYFYDGASRITKVGAGASGTVDPTEYVFANDTGLMTKVTYTAGMATSDAFYYYDRAAQLTTLTDWIDSLHYGYDAAGRLTRLTDYDDSTLDYTYDAAGNVITMNDYHGNSTV